MHPFDTGDALDAVAYLKAYLLGDQRGLAVLTADGDPAAMLAALTAITAGVLTRSDDDIPAVVGYIDHLAAGFIRNVTPPAGEGS